MGKESVALSLTHFSPTVTDKAHRNGLRPYVTIFIGSNFVGLLRVPWSEHVGFVANPQKEPVALSETLFHSYRYKQNHR